MTLVRKNVCLDSALIAEVNQVVREHGGRRRGASFSYILTLALKEYVQRHKAKQPLAVMAPELERRLDEKFGQVESWLRQAVWTSATYSVTASLLQLELMCGKRIPPSEAKQHFEQIRERAWKVVRRVKEPRDDRDGDID